MLVYIINGRVTNKNLDDISYHSYFMVYVANIGVIPY